MIRFRRSNIKHIHDGRPWSAWRECADYDINDPKWPHIREFINEQVFFEWLGDILSYHINFRHRDGFVYATDNALNKGIILGMIVDKNGDRDGEDLFAMHSKSTHGVLIVNGRPASKEDMTLVKQGKLSLSAINKDDEK